MEGVYKVNINGFSLYMKGRLNLVLLQRPLLEELDTRLTASPMDSAYYEFDTPLSHK